VLIVDTGMVKQGNQFAPAGNDFAFLWNSVANSDDGSAWDGNHDEVLDPFAGHGTFIAGLVADLAPGSHVAVEFGMSTYGDTDDVRIAQSLNERFPAGKPPAYDIVSLSFAGYCQDDDPPLALSEAIARIQLDAHAQAGTTPSSGLADEHVVFVASAGNDGSSRPTWPAAFESVIAVGAVGPNGPAWFSNWGPWVNASAPGVDVVSTFFDFQETGPMEAAPDFRGWAAWSGTSFAAPTVAAAIAWEWMGRNSQGSVGAVASWLLQRDGLFRHPWYGTIFGA
jgi:hypothetical protein